MKFKKEKEFVGIKGKVIATIAEATSAKAQVYIEKIRHAISIGDNEAVRLLLAEYNKACSIRQIVQENIVPTVGRSQLAQALTGQLSAIAEVEVNYSGLGTGTGTPANSDTTLGTEVYRKAIASQSYSSNIAYNTAFYEASDTNGTFYEHGIFMNATAAADSGVMLSRVLLNTPTGIAKSAVETLTVEHVHTLT